jgi:hypothetical protein
VVLILEVARHQRDRRVHQSERDPDLAGGEARQESLLEQVALAPPDVFDTGARLHAQIAAEERRPVRDLGPAPGFGVETRLFGLAVGGEDEALAAQEPVAAALPPIPVTRNS